MMKKNFLAIIPARSGSIRLKKKNLLNFIDKPLIAHSISEALKVSEINEVIVSTNCKKISKIAFKFGANIPFMRPNYLSKPNTPSYEVVLHAINHFKKKNIYFKNIILLQPTSPVRYAKHIKEDCRLFKNKKALGVISVCENDHPMEWVNHIDKSLSLNNFIKKKYINFNSGQFKKSYKLNGAIYILNCDQLEKQKTLFFKKKLYAYKMEKKYSVDIDTKQDFEYAEFLKLRLKEY